jgi:hypothetical protein
MPTKHTWLRKTLKEIARTLNNMADATTPYNLQDWLLRTPVVPVRRRDTYIELPAFAYTGLEWKGASEVISQFNFSASRKFTLSNLPTKPTDVNYGLCIRYRIGDTIHRFKLWDDDAFKLTGDVPVYSNQIIRANFVLEVWSYEDETVATNVAAIQMITSVRILPTDVSQLGVSAALAVGAEFRELGNTNTTATEPTTTSRMGWYRPDDYGIIDNGPTATPGALTNADTSGNMTDLADTGIGVDIYAGTNALNGHAWLRFNGATAYMDASYAGGVQGLGRTFVGVMRIYAAGVDAGGWIVADFDGFNADKFIHLTDTTAITSKQDGTNYTPTALTLVDDEWVIFYLTVDRSGNAVALHIEGAGTNEVTSGNVLGLATAMILGNDPNSVGAFAGKFDLAELLVFNAVLSEADLTTNIQYLSEKFFDGFSLPLTFNTGVAWLDNAD